jgi:hypothetical protein
MGTLSKIRALSLMALLTTLLQPNPFFVQSFTFPASKIQLFTHQINNGQYPFARSM